MIYNFACFIKSLKKSCKFKKISYKSFVNDFFDRYIDIFDIADKKNKKIEDKDKDKPIFTKSYVSELMNNNRNIPKWICKVLLIDDFEQKINEVVNSFVNDEIDRDLLVDSIKELKDKISKAKNLNKEQINKISNVENDKNFLSTAFTLALKVDNKIERKNFTKIIWKNGANSLNIIFGDIFKYGFSNRKKEKNIIVIPVNTSFETHITTKSEKEKFPLVSEQTIHGMWLSRMYECGYKEQEINDSIQSYLKKYNISLINDYNNYPIGTISEIYHENTIFYLLAISKFDEKNKAKSYKEDIITSLNNLLEHYDNFGQGYHLYLPLIGTGRSRVYLSSIDSLNLISSEMMKNKEQIQGNITIVALPKFQSKLIKILLKEK